MRYGLVVMEAISRTNGRSRRWYFEVMELLESDASDPLYVPLINVIKAPVAAVSKVKVLSDWMPDLITFARL